MRIIAGSLRGRKILPPDGARTTRPISDRVKQSLFDRLTSMQMIGGFVLDVFSGTGSLGLESLSRGADGCVFVERDRLAVQLLRRNLDDLGMAGAARVLAMDALGGNWLPCLAGAPFRVAFCDPPYRVSADPAGADALAKLIAGLAAHREPQAVLVLRTEDRTAPPAAAGWDGPRTHVYGSMALHFYEDP